MVASPASCENVAVNSLVIAAPIALAAAGGLVGYASAHPASQLFGSSIRRTTSAKKLAITFDDGPNPAITPKLLDLFARHNAHATFFVIGDFVKQAPDLLRETVARGHAIGNHTDNHPNLFRRTPQQIKNHLKQCTEAIQTAANITPKFFRPPYGLRNPWVIPAANRLNMQTVMWTLLAYDWKAQSKEWLIPRMSRIAERAKKNIPAHPNAPGDILCLHDGNHAQQNGDRHCTIEALEYWLPRWRDLGLEFVTIEEAVRTPAT
jgi:peptidoglycan/xylan/chitin deacetylase (PgdA/CDA1 family)